MNVLLINHYAGSPEMGMEFRPYLFAKEWNKMGHKVHIIAGDYSHLRRENPDVERDWQIQLLDGIYYHWVKTGEYHGNGVKRALSMERFVRKIIANAKSLIGIINPDVIICSSTYPLDTYAGQHLRSQGKKMGKDIKLIHEVHDMWPATLMEIGGMSKIHPFVVAMQTAENSAYKNADKVIAMLPYTKDYMMEHGMDEDKWLHIPLGLNSKDWEKDVPLSDEHRELIQSLKDKGHFVVGYFGGHALSNALDILLDAAKESKTVYPEVDFVLVGDGVEKNRLIERARNEGLDNVHFLPPVHKDEIVALTKLLDCSYIGCHKSELYRFGLCLNKMADTMMSGTPMLCSITSPNTWMDDCNAGIKVDSGDVEGIVKSIGILKDLSEEERKEMGERGRIYAEDKLNIQKLAEKIVNEAFV